ncbi:hypothetical protein [Alphaentomopoxvirus acuprea]|uniref:C2H2-type domain-containing protein n=1 Tax=Alphaentomopoxvirus acuprea TaxID=62099 RepID=W6JIY7_9POXV|nr:hypothetical protein BA82_gp213 [Anomala cuprea entomopoxvirus]BAO49573.1 hypothetical protein [Anomala cuprea entomopoxvirus]
MDTNSIKIYLQNNTNIIQNIIKCENLKEILDYIEHDYETNICPRCKDIDVYDINICNICNKEFKCNHNLLYHKNNHKNNIIQCISCKNIYYIPNEINSVIISKAICIKCL